jgi:hypothetical protein
MTTRSVMDAPSTGAHLTGKPLGKARKRFVRPH